MSESSHMGCKVKKEKEKLTSFRHFSEKKYRLCIWDDVDIHFLLLFFLYLQDKCRRNMSRRVIRLIFVVVFFELEKNEHFNKFNAKKKFIYFKNSSSFILLLNSSLLNCIFHSLLSLMHHELLPWWVFFLFLKSSSLMPWVSLQARKSKRKKNYSES